MLRVLSALVLAPLAALLVWAGGPFMLALALVAAGLMSFEWARLCAPVTGGRMEVAVVGTVLALVLAAGLAGPLAGIVAMTLGATAVAFLVRRRGGSPLWPVLGVAYVGLPGVAILWLTGLPDGSRTMLWLLLVIWSADTGAYAAGRLLGGWRLWPRVSPAKTWWGLAGGIAAGAVGGFVAGGALAAPGGTVLLLASAALAVVGQLGDLAESAVKRRFGVKDTGGLIPGHGGVLDRLDGLLAAAPALAVATAITGQSILTW